MNNLKLENYTRYTIDEATIKNCSIEFYGSLKYINLELEIPPFYQNYPTLQLPSLEDALKYLKRQFSLSSNSSLYDLVGKKCLSFSSNSGIFLLYNPENQEFFSLQAKFLHSQYNQLLQHNDLNLSHISKDDLIIYNFLSKLAPSSLLTEPLNVIKSKVFHESLLNEIETTNKQTSQIKVKI